MEEQLLSKLRSLGFSDKESKVYIASLKLGSAPIQKIAKLATVNRATTYVVVQGFMNKGLMSSYTKGKKRLFTPESPDKLSALIREDKAEVEAKENTINEILPSLSGLYDTTQGGNRPQVRFYEGKLGLNAVREEVLKAKSKEAFGIFNLDAREGVFTSEESNAFNKKRIAKKVSSHSIYSSSKGDILQDSKLEKVLYKYIDKSKYNSPIDISVFDDNVAITSFKEPMISVIIQNESIANAIRQILTLVEKSDTK
jgi:sugar-specific transcriptional regulator TrmB